MHRLGRGAIRYLRAAHTRRNTPQQRGLRRGVAATPAVREALALSARALRKPEESSELAQLLAHPQAAANLPEPRDLFQLDGTYLPCWQETDVDLYDNWLVAPSYYPYYYALFQRFREARKQTRLCEIGVRTGYVATVYAKAVGAGFYLGLDPNLYVPNGLLLAGQTLRILRDRSPGFDFALIQGYSWDPHVQASLILSGYYDVVHIDGDHTLPGKLIDLDLARRMLAAGGIVLVDDYDHHPIVREAIQRCWALGWFRQFLYVPTYRGLGVLSH